jgi:predicted HTH transcriptional regulator
MLKNQRNILLVIPLMLLVGCLSLNFGKNYSDSSKQEPPLEVIEQWLGAPLPSSYSNLKYDIISDTPDPQVRIAVNVPKEYFQTLINQKNLVKYDEFKNQLPNDLKLREWQESHQTSDFINKPLPSTTIWMTKNEFYPKYFWYQQQRLYLVYVSK